MASDQEWQDIRAIARVLAQDLRMTRAFDRHERRLRDRPYRRRTQIAVMAALLVAMLLLALGLPMAAPAALITSGLAWLTWHCPDSTSWQ
jgi:hypothetical protein